MRLGMGLRISDFLRAGAAAVVKSTLVNNLVSYWPLNEQSGTRVDVVGANDLTDNNTVLAANRGPSGTVASFVAANSESLSVDSDVFAAQNDFTIITWLDGDATQGGVNTRPISRDSNGAWDYTMLYNGGVGFFYLLNPTGGLVSVSGSTPSSAAGMHMLAVGVDTATKKAWVSIDGGAKVESSAYTGTLTLNTGKAFTLGAMSGGGNHYQGKMGPSGFWTNSLSPAELTSLFNNGNGKTYADLTTAEKVGLVSYWNLDEVSGTRADSHGSNDLTDNNTVGSVINAGDAMDGAAASFVAANTESLSHATATFPTSEADFSVSMWIKPTAASGAHTIINSGTGSGANEWLLSHGADFTLTVDGDSDTAGTCTTDWQHVVLTYVTATKVMTLYVDTVSVVSGTGTGTGAYKAANDLFLGVQGDGTTEPYGGQIDEVAFWSRALSTAEIADLYAAGAGFFYNTTTEDFE